MINAFPPFAVTRDLLDLGNTPIRCWVNGELRQDGNTEFLMFDVPTLRRQPAVDVGDFLRKLVHPIDHRVVRRAVKAHR